MNLEYIVVRGGGDIASGTIQKLYRSGFNVVVLEVEKPTAIRRNVAFSDAIYNGETEVEGIKGIKANNIDEIKEAHKNNLKVNIFTVNNPIYMRMCIANKVDGVFTDYPELLNEILTK